MTNRQPARATRRAIACAVLLGLGALTPLALPAAPAAAADCAVPATTVVRAVPSQQIRLDPQRAWTLTRGTGVVVAVVDTGVDAGVPQLAGHVLRGSDTVNSAGTGRGDSDCEGHGTFVAGIIAAQPAPGIGFVGIAPGVVILPIRQTTDGRDGSSASLARAIDLAVNDGARVVNVSVAADAPSPALRDAVAYALSRDVLIVAAASNSALQGNPVTYPAAYPGVLAVGAVDDTGKRSDFSESGSFVGLVAPGTNILSLGTGGPGLALDQGTSFATAFVTGAAALVRAYHPGLTAAQVVHRLEATADHPGSSLPDPELGWGTVNPYNAVAAVLPEEAGGPAPAASHPAPLHLAAAPAAAGSDTPVLLLAAAGLTAAAAVLAVAAVLPRARRRGWRPAGRPAPDTD
ncbi:type VII secretion-associated serine protease mycosin [Streptacidiphilus sp. EB129]|uniref:type VII secretion-associated serine protease mycosin n=1 Tax=Streptacidiphilus sp. EB129 TaxID=3156262 RepID=UPI0035174D0C